MEKDKTKFYKKWWFWGIVIFTVCIIVILSFLIFEKKVTLQEGIGTAGISKEEFEEVNLGMTHFEVDSIVDKLDEWNDDNIYHKACEKISSSYEDKKYIYTYKYYGEKKGYAIITYEADYSEGYYTLKYPKVIKKEKFDLK